MLNSVEQALYVEESHWRAQRGSAVRSGGAGEIKQVTQAGRALPPSGGRPSRWHYFTPLVRYCSASLS